VAAAGNSTRSCARRDQKFHAEAQRRESNLAGFALLFWRFFVLHLGARFDLLLSEYVPFSRGTMTLDKSILSPFPEEADRQEDRLREVLKDR